MKLEGKMEEITVSGHKCSCKGPGAGLQGIGRLVCQEPREGGCKWFEMSPGGERGPPM